MFTSIKRDAELHFEFREKGRVRKLGALAIERDDLIRRFFIHEIPTEAEVEHAINYPEGL